MSVQQTVGKIVYCKVISFRDLRFLNTVDLLGNKGERWLYSFESHLNAEMICRVFINA